MKHFVFAILLAVTLPVCMLSQTDTVGCTVPTACNYDESATISDPSLCDFESCIVYGCTTEVACNFDSLATVSDGSCEYVSCQGCTDQTACNFDPNATIENGACLFNDSDADGICDDVDDCIGLVDACGICNGNDSTCLGCTLPFACNYDPEAVVDDGSCEFICPGCTDVSACNYDSGAIQDDGTCFYPEDIGSCDCEGNVLDECGICGGAGIPEGQCDCAGNVIDECGVCGGSGIPEGDCGCDGSVLDECGVCGGNGIPDGFCDCDGNVIDVCGVCGGDGFPEGNCDCDGNVLDQCGVCGGDGTSCVGCTYEFACNYNPEVTILDITECEFGACPGCTIFGACNYNPTVTINDGSCEWCSCAEGQVVSSAMAPQASNAISAALGYWLEMQSIVTHTGGPLDGQTTYRLYLNMVNSDDYLSSCSGDQDNVLIINSSNGTWYNDIYNTGWNAQGINPLFLPVFPDLAYDSFLTIGAEDSTTPAAQHPSDVWGGNDVSNAFRPGPGYNLVVDDATGGAWYTSFPGIEQANSHVAFAGEDKRVLVAQFTTAGVITGQMQVQVFVNGDQGNEFRDVLPFCNAGECGGCTDEAASNYDPEALYDDGSCQGPISGCTDELACNYDATANEEDGSCEFETCVGCTDQEALNYCPVFTIEDGSCLYDYLGCMDESACNFFEEATYDDGNQCQYIQEGECDCDGNVLDECGVCGGAGIPEGQCDCAGNVLDECGVCGGDGIPEGQCDCAGNILDECGVCGGEGIAEGECDCEGNVLDECGVCGGPGIADGACDCAGNVLDALGVCGGDCLTDQNNNGICDLTELENPVGGPETCGLGTVWDEETQTCIVAYPADINFDGCVQLNDLLDLLSAYGLCQTAEAAWSCGDPLEYQGYDYETVKIGEQCWFAENARYLPFVSPSDLGWEDDGGAHAYVAGYEGTSVEEAKTQSEYEEYGTLYNFVSVQESLMCPQGWHVPSLSEWDVLKGSVGISSAYKLKSAPPVWDGTNELGFNAIRVPVRTSNGSFTDYSKADFWTSTSIEESDNAWGQELNTGDDTFTDDPNGKGSGNPIRCLKNAE